MGSTLRAIVLITFMATVCYAAPSNTVSIPNSFSAGTVIQSAQVNANNNEIQNKYNAHSHTDITQLGVVTTGTWSGNPVTTQYGGTGKDFSAVAQGAVPYFSGAGTMSSLGAGTNGQFLTSGGAGANVSWTTGGSAKDAITRGFEASASVGHTAIWVYGGSLFHGSTGVDVATTTVLTLATGNDWSSGSVVTYGGGAGWCYIGAKSDGGNGYIKLLGNIPVSASDSLGNSSGTSLYGYDGTRYWRIIGAFRVNTSNKVEETIFQRKDKIMYDIPRQMSTTLSAGAWTDGSTLAKGDCSTLIPQIATTGIFGIDSQASGSGGNLAQTWIRPNGSTWNLVNADCNGGGSGTVSPETWGGQRICLTDTTQKINYYNNAAAAGVAIDVEGYYLDIR